MVVQDHGSRRAPLRRGRHAWPGAESWAATPPLSRAVCATHSARVARFYAAALPARLSSPVRPSSISPHDTPWREPSAAARRLCLWSVAAAGIDPSIDGQSGISEIGSQKPGPWPGPCTAHTSARMSRAVQRGLIYSYMQSRRPPQPNRSIGGGLGQYGCGTRSYGCIIRHRAQKKRREQGLLTMGRLLRRPADRCLSPFADGWISRKHYGCTLRL